MIKNIKNLSEIFNSLLTKHCYLNHYGNSLPSIASILAKDFLPIVRNCFKFVRKVSITIRNIHFSKTYCRNMTIILGRVA